MFGEVAEKLRRSTVRITSGPFRGSARERGSGSGVVWTAGGTVITNAHVVRDRAEVEFWDGSKAEAVIAARDDRRDLARLETMLPGASLGLDPEKLEGRVAFRAVVRDRMPVAGPLGPNLHGAFAYGSRGMLWAGLCGELIASQLEGEPLPVERKLAAAVAPDRFILREKRKTPTAARA